MIHFNVPGAKRKEMAKVIATWLEESIDYKGTPTFAFEIGDYTIDREGNLIAGEEATEETTERLVEHLIDEGFECDMATEPEEDEEERLTVSVPTDELTDEQLGNLEKLVAAKANLLKKAIGTEDLRILKTADGIHFPWFDAGTAEETALTYTKLIDKLIAFAKNATRVTAKEKTAENDKYAFRCFLLRLGFIGEEYKPDRKILLANLGGNSAFKAANKEVE